MNPEKLIMTAALVLTVLSGAYIKMNMSEPPQFGKKKIKPEVEQVPDFDLDTVFDNTPFASYYKPEKRNPFIPFREKKESDVSSNPNKVNQGDPSFEFPWKFKDPEKEPEKDPVTVTDIPEKPHVEEGPLKEETFAIGDPEQIPVTLIGFAETEKGINRKAILSNKVTKELYSVEEGDSVLGLYIERITPFVIVIKLKNGKKVEFSHDILRKAQSNNVQNR